MNKYLKEDNWKIIEDHFNPNNQRSSESIFSIGNGKFGQRANFEEDYTGDSLQGNYVAGIYYPDKTKVGWWKNGYPEYFAKVLNSINWIGIHLEIDGETVNLAEAKNVDSFSRILDMQSGLLTRECELELKNGIRVSLKAQRFCSLADDECAAIKYSVSTNDNCSVQLVSYLDGDVRNEDANWEESFWNSIDSFSNDNSAGVSVMTKKTEFVVGAAMKNSCFYNGKKLNPEPIKSDFKVSHEWKIDLNPSEELELHKFIGITTSLNYEPKDVLNGSEAAANRIFSIGFEKAQTLQAKSWSEVWKNGDIKIEGDVSAQQAIRFNIFQLNQTYTGKDNRLNIGPKGFTGEKYGGSTYWDTEAYCIPFYLNTQDASVAKQLLVYRYNQLDKAIENAEKLGLRNGAALYPMVTMNGEECHNEWEITFEEIHRNGAIAFAIFNYIRHTNDQDYLAEFGFDVLLGISRFWMERVNWSEHRKAYVILGVTGPNEYENNVNNNWYTNYIATWCLKYTSEVIDFLKKNHPIAFQDKVSKYDFREEFELEKWDHIIQNMYLPKMADSDIRLQQDGFLDKELLQVKDLSQGDRPINQNWSWDKILRSVYIKQADVLQGFYFFEDEFSTEELKANFDFYEPFTVHESSLSPCIHAIQAAKLGYEEKAYELYLRTSRLDLDDYNHEAYQGLHITSMAGTWMSVVEGFGGLRIKNDQLCLNPMLPSQWTGYSFKIMFRNRLLHIHVTDKGTSVVLEGEPITIQINGEPIQLTKA